MSDHSQHSSDQPNASATGASMHQPPYEHQRYAQYAPEPWDDGRQAQQSMPRVWYFFLAFVVSVMLLGTLLVFMGFFCHYNPQGMLDAQAQSGMSQTFSSIAEVKQAAVLYWLMGAMYLFAGAIVFALPRNMLLWGYGIALMFLAALSGCMAPLSVAMFVFWLFPSTRAYFKR